MLYFVEAGTTGAGLTILTYLNELGLDVALVTNQPARYAESRGGEALAELDRRGRLKIEDTTDYTPPTWLREDPGEAGVISATDKYLPYTAALAQDLGAPFLSVDAVSIIRDKRRARQLYDRLGVGHVAWADANSDEAVRAFVESLSGPVLLKNVKGSGSMDIAFAEDAEDAVEKWTSLIEGSTWLDGDLMIEEYIAGPMVSYEVLVNEGVPLFIGITDRQLSRLPAVAEVSYTFPSAVTGEHENEMRRSLHAVVSELGMKQGFLHAEFILTPRAAHLVEINARLPGGLFTPAIQDCLDGDFYRLVHDSAVGLRVEMPQHNGLFSSGCVSYAHQRGVATSDSDVAGALTYPWLVDVVGAARKGDPLSPPTDFRGSAGHVRSLAPTASLALTSARAAADLLVPELIREESQ